MIIQCRVCQTKYRFDETKIPTDGAWVRCTRCEQVFFQHPPLSSLGEPLSKLEEEIDKADTPDQIPLTAARAVDMRELSKVPDLDELDELDGVSESPEARPASKRVWIWALGALLLVLLVGGGSLFLFTPYGQLAMKELNALFPGLASFTAQEAPLPVGPAQVKILDVRQRFVNNALLGNMRIVEGVAMNTSPYPMARIKVRADLFDMINTPVRQSLAFCGNLLTDEELGTMSEEQIFRELANPQGSDVPNDKIAPHGTIPFMIVFIREPPGVTRTFIIPAAAERLLAP
ncbi:MAG: hypothetical protein QG555_1658 [Thermodesulfobacteriota bacterium]|nr:hypothetical protein [Thermodesulfobacteriota bacterium]